MPVINRSKMDHFIFSYLAPSFMDTGNQPGSTEFFLNYRYRENVMFLPILDKSSPYLCTVALFDGYGNKSLSGKDTINIKDLEFVTGFFISPDFGEVSIDYNWNTKDGGLMLKIKEKVLGTVQSFFRDDPASFAAAISAFKDLPGAMSLVSLFFDADKLFGHLTNIARYMTNGSIYYPEKHIKAFDGAKIQIPNIKVKKYYISGSSYADPYQAVIDDLNRLKLLPMLYNPKSYRVTNTNYITEVQNVVDNAPPPTEAPPANDGAFVHAITQTNTFQNIIHMIAFLYYYTNLAINAPLVIATRGVKLPDQGGESCSHVRFGPFFCSRSSPSTEYNTYYFPNFFYRPIRFSWCVSLVGYTGISRTNNMSSQLFYQMYENNYRKFLADKGADSEIAQRQFIFSQGAMIAWMFGGFYSGLKDPQSEVYGISTFGSYEYPVITFFNTSPVLLFAMGFAHKIKVDVKNGVVSSAELSFPYNYLRVERGGGRLIDVAFDSYYFSIRKTRLVFNCLSNVRAQAAVNIGYDCAPMISSFDCPGDWNLNVRYIEKFEKENGYVSDNFSGYPLHIFNDIFMGDYNYLSILRTIGYDVLKSTEIKVFAYDENDLPTGSEFKSSYAGLAHLLVISPEFNDQFGKDNNDWITAYYLGMPGTTSPYHALDNRFSKEYGGIGIPMYHPLGHYGAYLSYFSDELFVLVVIEDMLHRSYKNIVQESNNINEAIATYLKDMSKLARTAIFPRFKKVEGNKYLDGSIDVGRWLMLSSLLVNSGSGITVYSDPLNWLFSKNVHRFTHPLVALVNTYDNYLPKTDLQSFISGLMNLYSDMPDSSLPKILAKEIEKQSSFESVTNGTTINFYNGYHIILGLIFYQQYVSDTAIPIESSGAYRAAAKSYFSKQREQAEKFKKEAEQLAKENGEILDQYVDILQRISAAPTNLQSTEESSAYLLNLLASVALFGFNSSDSVYLPYADKLDSSQAKYDTKKFCQGCNSPTSYPSGKSYIWYPTDLQDKAKSKFDELIELRNKKQVLKLDGEHVKLVSGMGMPFVVFYFMFKSGRTIPHCNFCQFLYDSAYYHNLYNVVTYSSQNVIFFNSRIPIYFLLEYDENMDIQDMYTSALFHRLAKIYQNIKQKYPAYFNQAINVINFETGESVGTAGQGVEFKTQTQAHSELFLGRILKLFNVMLLMPPGNYDYIPYFKALFTALLNGSTKVTINEVDYYIGYYIIILHNVNAFKGLKTSQSAGESSSRVLSYLLPKNVEVKTSEQYTYPFIYEKEFQGDNRARPLYVTLEVTFEPINDLLFLYATYGDLDEIRAALGIAADEIMDDITNVNRSTSTGCSSGGGGGDGTESYGSC